MHKVLVKFLSALLTLFVFSQLSTQHKKNTLFLAVHTHTTALIIGKLNTFSAR